MLHVKHRIECGVVVHLELPVLLKPALPGNQLPPQTVEPTHEIVALLDQDAVAFTVSLGVGLVFGLLPASRASRLNPTEALRYE